jgi:hypothetical protein
MPASVTLLPWLPALLIAALSAVALATAAIPPTPGGAKERRLAAIAILGLLALGTMVWQAWAAGEEIAFLKRNDRSKELAAEVRALQKQVATVIESARGRSLDRETAAKLAEELRPSGRRKVVVSCTPNDSEAYEYATDLVDALKAANWDARGPETTTIFGNIRAMGVNVFDGSPGSDTAKTLVDAFVKLGIPYQTRVPPSEAAKSGDVELFIGSKPDNPAMAKIDTGH